MDRCLQKFLRKKISLTALGFEICEENEPYFCTPLGAKILGWAGVDGIHFCTIRGWGNMIFAVSPMNTAPDYVHPIAADFEMLLRLLLACGDMAALEQAWQWNRETFENFLRENLPAPTQKAVLAQIGESMNLTPVKDPWQYLQMLQKTVDCSKIRYASKLDDRDTALETSQSTPTWKVYYDGNLWEHSGKDRPGREITLNAAFQWADRQWRIPALYLCGKGLVVDFCTQVAAEKIHAFMEKWGLTSLEEERGREFTQEEEWLMEAENPLVSSFHARLMFNGRELKQHHGCSTVYNPCLPAEEMGGEKQWMEHYRLPQSDGWIITRAVFPWEGKREKQIDTLALTMRADRQQIFGPHFAPEQPGDQVAFCGPDGTAYTLTVENLEQQTLPEELLPGTQWRYPTYCVAMTYTVSPEMPTHMTVVDCAEGDHPVERSSDGMETAACIGIIGGADGPTALVCSRSPGASRHMAVSSLHFVPVKEKVQWRIVFYEKPFPDGTFQLDIQG